MFSWFETSFNLTSNIIILYIYIFYLWNGYLFYGSFESTNLGIKKSSLAFKRREKNKEKCECNSSLLKLFLFSFSKKEEFLLKTVQLFYTNRGVCLSKKKPNYVIILLYSDSSSLWAFFRCKQWGTRLLYLGRLSSCNNCIIGSQKYCFKDLVIATLNRFLHNHNLAFKCVTSSIIQLLSMQVVYIHSIMKQILNRKS